MRADACDFTASLSEPRPETCSPRAFSWIIRDALQGSAAVGCARQGMRNPWRHDYGLSLGVSAGCARSYAASIQFGHARPGDERSRFFGCSAFKLRLLDSSSLSLLLFCVERFVSARHVALLPGGEGVRACIFEINRGNSVFATTARFFLRQCVCARNSKFLWR